MPFELEVPQSAGDPIRITLQDNGHLFVLGANGTGKSALMQAFYRTNSAHAVRIAGHRQIWFEDSAVSITGRDRRRVHDNMVGADQRERARWHDNHAQTRPTIAIFDLIDAENIRAREIAGAVDADDIEEARQLSQTPAPLATLNELLRLSNLPIVLSVRENEEVMASKAGGEPYPAAELSDGERSALLIAATVLTAKPGTLFLIDEPERHLHRSIISPLITHLFARRPDCAFVVSTHDVSLARDHTEASTLLLRGCTYTNKSASAWDADLVSGALEIDDGLKQDILGARRKILFVEGTDADSLDKPLYALLFPDVSIVSKNSCREVERAVAGIRAAEDLHWLHTFGLVDGDARAQEDAAALQGQNVFALPFYSVEAIYYHPDMLRHIAQRQVTVLGGEPDELVTTATTQALASLEDQAERFAHHVAQRLIREAFFARLPDVHNFDPTQRINLEIDVPGIVTGELDRYRRHYAAGEFLELIKRYPVRKSPALVKIATALQFPSRQQYEQAVLKLLSEDDEVLAQVRGWFNDLTAALQ